MLGKACWPLELYQLRELLGDRGAVMGRLHQFTDNQQLGKREGGEVSREQGTFATIKTTSSTVTRDEHQADALTCPHY